MTVIIPKSISYSRVTSAKKPHGISLPKINLSQKNTLVDSKSSPLSDSQKVVIFLKSSGYFAKKLITSLYSVCYWALKEFMCMSIKMYAWVTQFFSWIILWPLFSMFFNIKVHGRLNLKGLKAPHIMISNHSYFFDSFLFRLAVGSKINMMPMRFMAVNKFNSKRLNFLQKTGIIPLIYSLFGVFVVEHGLGLNKNLKRAREIINNNGIVAMFPEGHMNKKPEIAMFRRGVSALALSTGAPVLPLAIRIGNKTKDTGENRKRAGFLHGKLRKTIHIHIGTSRYLQTHHTYEELAEELRQEVSQLRDK